MPKHAHVDCDYCGKPAKLVKGDRIYLTRNEKTANKHFWFCEPCEAWVGCHENSPTLKPVGRLANSELRQARRGFHNAFDILWHAGFERMFRINHEIASKKQCARIAYKWLAERMGIGIHKCDVGLFTVEQCNQARKICESLGNELLARYKSTQSEVSDE